MSKLFSLDDLRQKEEENKKRGPEYYAGGNDSRTGGGSGLSVIDPRDGNSARRSDNLLSRIVENAQANTANVDMPSPLTGSARRVTLYRNGFVVDDGPFRALDSAESRRFLQTLADGYVPSELQGSGEAEVSIALNDKTEEDYIPPPPPAYVAFGGESVSLGGGSTSSSNAIITASTIANVLVPVEVNNSVPTTTLQIRLLNGKRIKVKVNHSHTVRQLLALLDSMDSITTPFVMSAGFPPKDISNFDNTINEAGLIGASINFKSA